MYLPSVEKRMGEEAQAATAIIRLTAATVLGLRVLAVAGLRRSTLNPEPGAILLTELLAIVAVYAQPPPPPRFHAIIFVCVYDTDTDMAALGEAIPRLSLPGVEWKSTKLVPVAYGVHKLQVIAVLSDPSQAMEALMEEAIAGIVGEDVRVVVELCGFHRLR
eukprot:TRINITY_DN1280_c0_g2_i1.p2 TRINITY_DN1280_c0_g2~~TRINITY_DN1280_c0_g2_i1.p2  ORF type:complete len:162 (-),score=34.83 TRINITY_DN1280_c0_g2_i1:213-698(-)